MKNVLLILGIILTLAFSCKDQGPDLICNVNNPTEDLPWLKSEIERRKQSQNDISKYFYIEQGEYNGQTVFIYNNCCPMCNTILSVYDCNGKKLFDLDSTIEIKNIKKIWVPEDFPCQ